MKRPLGVGGIWKGGSGLHGGDIPNFPQSLLIDPFSRNGKNASISIFDFFKYSSSIQSRVDMNLAEEAKIAVVQLRFQALEDDLMATITEQDGVIRLVFNKDFYNCQCESL